MDDNMTNEIGEEEVERTVEPPLYQISEGYIRYWEVLWKLKLGLFSFQVRASFSDTFGRVQITQVDVPDRSNLSSKHFQELKITWAGLQVCVA